MRENVQSEEKVPLPMRWGFPLSNFSALCVDCALASEGEPTRGSLWKRGQAGGDVCEALSNRARVSLLRARHSKGPQTEQGTRPAHVAAQLQKTRDSSH